MTQENITTQGNVSYLPWVVPAPSNAQAEPAQHTPDTGHSSTGRLEELEQQLHEIALRALGRKDYSRKELGRYLQKRFTALLPSVADEVDDNEATSESNPLHVLDSVDPEVLIASVLDELETQGWLDEVRAIEALLLRSQYRQLGQQAKRQKLQQLGYAEMAITRVLADTDIDEEYQQLRELAEKRNTQLLSLEDEVRERRLISYLMRRGYASSQVFSVVRQLGQHE